MLYIENLNGLGLKPTTKFVLYTILKRAFFENKNKIQMTYSYIARQTELSRSTVLREIEFLINSEYIKSERGLFKSQENVNRITHEITLTDKSISILNAEAAKPQNKAIKTEETQPQADVHKTSNKPSNKPVKTEPRQPQAEAEKTPQTAPKQVETEQSDKVTCKSIEEVLELLNYQAERFADGKQNEFEFRRVAKYIASKNMQLSKNIRYDEDNNKFVNFV